MASPIVVSPETAPRPLNVGGERITVLASGSQTGGYEIFLQAGAEGAGPPPHSHDWDECFYVIGGELTFGMGDQELVAKPGTFVHLPAGTVHWFRFGKDGGRMVSVTSHEGAARMFADFDREIPPASPDIGKLVEIAKRYGVSFPA